MQRKIKHLFQIPFTGKTPGSDGGGFSGQEWYDKRADLFEKYTVKSLRNQTNKDFYVWVTFRPEEAKNPTTARILDLLKGLKYIATFNGTMFTEDRAVWHNKDLPERLDKTLPIIKDFIGEADYIYETNLDSDDTVHKDFSELIHRKEFKDRGALYCKNGFVYNTQGRLAIWNNPKSNQNYTIMFPYEKYFNTKDRLEYMNGFASHEQIPEKFNAEQLPDNLYCSIIHGGNISTVWTHPFKGEEIIYEDDKRNILKDFIEL